MIFPLGLQLQLNWLGYHIKILFQISSWVCTNILLKKTYINLNITNRSLEKKSVNARKPEKTCFLKIIQFQISELNHRVLNLFEIQGKLMIDFFDHI